MRHPVLLILITAAALSAAVALWLPGWRDSKSGTAAPAVDLSAWSRTPLDDGGYTLATENYYLPMIKYPLSLTDVAAAYHHAGYRGIKLLGWVFILAGCALMASRYQGTSASSLASGHAVMGAVFGGLHLAYGIYLYFTEQRGNEM